MKNFLVGAIRPVAMTWAPGEGHVKNTNWEVSKSHYEAMYQMSRASAKKFLQGEWQEVLFKSPVLDARMYQIAQWYMIKELWFSQPCNILCMGADTLFIKPTEVFGRYDTMRMFNYTDPKTHPEFEHNFNDDIRYYPATMDPKVWEVGEEHMLDWFSHKEADWACGQHIHNHQLWSQGISAAEMLEPTMAFQTVKKDIPECESWNGCSFADVKIVHFHGSRSSENRVQVMYQLYQQVGI